MRGCEGEGEGEVEGEEGEGERCVRESPDSSVARVRPPPPHLIHTSILAHSAVTSFSFVATVTERASAAATAACSAAA